FDAAGKLLFTVQPGLDGRFEVPLSRGAPVLLAYDVQAPPLGDGDPRSAGHFIAVEAPVPAAGDATVEVPVPVLAVAGFGEPAARWSALLDAIEGRRQNGRKLGALTFALGDQGDLPHT